MAKDYEVDKAGMREIGTSSQMQAAMTGLATAGMAGAQAIAPVKTGEYRDKFRVEEIRERVGWDRDERAGARVVNDAAHATTVEARHHILATVKAIIESGGF
jgi:hypothetical protein